MDQNINENQVEETMESKKISGKTILLIGGAIGGLALAAFALFKKNSEDEDLDDYEDFDDDDIIESEESTVEE